MPNLRDSLSIARVPFKESGTNVGHDMINICCPFCGEEKFHCGIHRDDLWYKCFVCGEGGGWRNIAYKLQEKYPNVNWLSLSRSEGRIRYLDERPRLSRDLGELTREFTEKDRTPFEYLTEIPYLDELNSKNRPRGFSSDLIKKYRIGIGINELKGYVTFQQGKNLIARRYSLNETLPRYWKSINDGIFIFGEDQVYELNSQWVCIVEGVFDVMALPYGHGLAILGSIMSDGWISHLIASLPTGTRTVILALDKGVPHRTLVKFTLLLQDCGLEVKLWDWSLFEVAKDLDEVRIVYGEELISDYIESLLKLKVDDFSQSLFL